MAPDEAQYAAVPGSEPSRGGVVGEPIGAFRVARFEFALRPLDPIALPPHAGSTFRGGFGRAFRRWCGASMLGAESCALGDRCPYHYIFETPVPSGSAILARTPTAPRPFVLEPPIDPSAVYEPGSTLTLGLVLVGRAIDYLPHFIHAFEELGQVGLGRGQGRCRLERVTASRSGGSVAIYDGARRRLSGNVDTVTGDGFVLHAATTLDADAVTLHFVTPTQLHYEGRVAGPEAFHVLVRNLLRRVNFLNYFHCGGELMNEPGTLIDAARSVETVDARVRWHAWERYSARQDQRVPMRGFTARVTYRGDLAPFLPWLAAGEWVHVGKAATFGMGRYEIKR